MAYSGIGGQAVMEGVMMRNGAKYAVAVRTPSGSIDVKTYDLKSDTRKFDHIPDLRGMVSFISSLVIGMRSLMQSAEYFDEDDDEGPVSNAAIYGTVALSVILAVVFFTFIPYALSRLITSFTDSYTILALVEGVIRVAIFILYIVLIGRTKDIGRTFMYHGAGHKCINCIEHGLPLTLENVRRSSREHKRCGTSFIFIVLLISILVFMFIRVDHPLLQLLLRILLIPLIAGISFEFIRLAGRSDSALVNALSKPGLMMQHLTTREPDDDMIEVGMASVEAVFDWQEFESRMNTEADYS